MPFVNEFHLWEDGCVGVILTFLTFERVIACRLDLIVTYAANVLSQSILKLFHFKALLKYD